MASSYSLRRKFNQTGVCPFNDVLGQLKGGLQEKPKWFNSVRKYPPQKMWRIGGKVPRASVFYGDRARKLLLHNRRRPDWVPSLHVKPEAHALMGGAVFQDAFQTAINSSDPDVEFAACQAWFMKHKMMSEDEAYVQAKFRMRDLIAQKRRVWEVYRRSQLMSDREVAQVRSENAGVWVDKLKEEVKMSAAKRLAARDAAIKDVIDREKMKEQSRIFEQSDQSSKSKKGSDENNKECSISEPMSSDYLVSKEEKEFNAEWQDKVKLMRFIEYCDYIAKNPHLGLKDPTDLLTGIPREIENRNEVRKKLLLKMAKKHSRRYIER